MRCVKRMLARRFYPQLRSLSNVAFAQGATT